jgi:tRNA threonylcarbamoyladenosine biosynthesis protein TsaB
MKILAIETATMLGGLALMDSEEGLIAERRLNIRSTHSERLMPELEAMLDISGIRVSDLGAVAVSIGPGGFTGLRVGLSAAKGLCFSAGLKLAPVPTLEAIALCLPCSTVPVCPMMDARRGEVYTGLYSTASGIPKELIAPQAVKAKDFADSLKGHEEIVLLGQGALVYREDIEAAFKGKAHYPPLHLMVPSPASVASLGLRILEAGDLPDPISLAPRYLRRSEAEIKAG